jgi:hypothetical protein
MADAPDTAPSSSSRTPADFLNSIKGKPVVVKLNSGVDYKGKNIFLRRSSGYQRITHATAVY